MGSELKPAELRAWRAFLDAQATLLRRLEAELVAGEGMTLAEFDVLAQPWMARDGRLRMTLAYGSRTHRRETAERLAAAYAEALRQLIQHGRESEQVSAPPPRLAEGGGAPWSPLVALSTVPSIAPLAACACNTDGIAASANASRHTKWT